MIIDIATKGNRNNLPGVTKTYSAFIKSYLPFISCQIIDLKPQTGRYIFAISRHYTAHFHYITHSHFIMSCLRLHARSKYQINYTKFSTLSDRKQVTCTDPEKSFKTVRCYVSQYLDRTTPEAAASTSDRIPRKV